MKHKIYDKLLAWKEKRSHKEALLIDVLEDVSVLLTATKRKRDAEGIRVRISEETILCDVVKRRALFERSQAPIHNYFHRPLYIILYKSRPRKAAPPR